LLRLNVYFDNPVPREGSYEDRGGYWAPVELWHREAEHWSTLYQKGMRVLVEGRTVRDEWEDSEDNARVTFKIEARRVGVLPHRVHSVIMRERSSEPAASACDARRAKYRAGQFSYVQTQKAQRTAIYGLTSGIKIAPLREVAGCYYSLLVKIHTIVHATIG